MKVMRYVIDTLKVIVQTYNIREKKLYILSNSFGNTNEILLWLPTQDHPYIHLQSLFSLTITTIIFKRVRKLNKISRRYKNM